MLEASRNRNGERKEGTGKRMERKGEVRVRKMSKEKGRYKRNSE